MTDTMAVSIFNDHTKEFNIICSNGAFLSRYHRIELTAGNVHHVILKKQDIINVNQCMMQDRLEELNHGFLKNRWGSFSWVNVFI